MTKKKVEKEVEKKVEKKVEKMKKVLYVLLEQEHLQNVVIQW